MQYEYLPVSERRGSGEYPLCTGRRYEIANRDDVLRADWRRNREGTDSSSASVVNLAP